MASPRKSERLISSRGHGCFTISPPQLPAAATRFPSHGSGRPGLVLRTATKLSSVGFEPTAVLTFGLRVRRLNHSATRSLFSATRFSATRKETHFFLNHSANLSFPPILVFVLGGYGGIVRRLMLAAYNLGLCSAGYAFVSYEVLLNSCNSSSANATENIIACRAYEGLLDISLYVPSNCAYSNFTKEVRRRMSEKPFKRAMLPNEEVIDF